LANFLEVKNNIVKDEIQEIKEELPQNIEEFDYSKYEEEKENEEQMDDIEEFYKN